MTAAAKKKEEIEEGMARMTYFLNGCRLGGGVL